MTGVHEEVQDRTGEDQKPERCAEHVRPMLAEQQECGYGKERQEHQSKTVTETLPLGLIVMGHVLGPEA